MVARRPESDPDHEPSLAEPRQAAADGSSKVEEADRLRAEIRETGGRILASSAHGIRNHITIIQSYLEIIHSELTAGLSDEQLSFLGIAYDHVLRLRSLIDDLVLIGSLETGIADLNPTAVDLGKEATRIISEMHDAAQRKSITLRSEVEGEPAIGEIDPESLSDLVRRLVDNAVRFTPEGGAVVVRVFCEPPWAAMSISDTGHGIPTEHLDEAFELFTQFHVKGGEPKENHGLGLPIVRRLVEASSGRIDLESTVGGGTVVTLRIPAS